MATSTRPRSDDRKLSEVARHVVIPSGIVTTAWPRVVAKCAEVGVTFDGWQHGVGSIALGKRQDGKYAATVGGVVLSIPRQVGKTFLVGMIVIALCLLNPGLTVLWTAHRTRTATMTFTTLKNMTGRKKMLPFMLDPRSTNGEQEVRFRNGSVIMFGARADGFGRGFDEVDLEIFDEAQILSEKALDDMVPAANQSRQSSGALLFFMGTPPRPADPGEEFTNRRNKALSGKSKDMAYVEFSADEGVDPDDQKQWAKANPSFPLRTPIESMQRMRANLTDDSSFKREALGIWDPDDTPRVITHETWKAQLDPTSVGVRLRSLAIDVAPDQSKASVHLAAQREGGDWHVELLEARSGTAWLVPFVAAVVRKNPEIRAVVADEVSVAATLRPDFEAEGIALTLTSAREMAAAYAATLRGLADRTVWHVGQTQMNAPLAAARSRKIGSEGLQGWSRANSTDDITQVVSMSLALWGSQAPKARVKKPVSRKRERRVMFSGSL